MLLLCAFNSHMSESMSLRNRQFGLLEVENVFVVPLKIFFPCLFCVCVIINVTCRSLSHSVVQ